MAFPELILSRSLMLPRTGEFEGMLEGTMPNVPDFVIPDDILRHGHLVHCMEMLYGIVTVRPTACRCNGALEHRPGDCSGRNNSRKMLFAVAAQVFRDMRFLIDGCFHLSGAALS